VFKKTTTALPQLLLSLSAIYELWMGLGSSQLEKNLGQLPNGDHYFGFENYGNTCYCNSVLQALYFCLPLRERILNHFFQHGMPHLDYRDDQDETLLISFCDLFYSIHSQKKKVGVLGPKKFIQKLRSENSLFRSGMQQDAHEFLNYLLNEIASLLEKQKRLSQRDLFRDTNSHGGNTFVHRIFEGILTNETKCLCCENVTSKDESFLDLSVDIEQNTSITQCLKQFSATEMLHGRDKFWCDNCNNKQEAQKRIKIKRLPNVLVLHLKRFKYIEQTQRYKKLAYRVVFPFELRLQNTTDDARNPERLYQLFAIVIHLGSGPNQGHYISIIKSNGRWLLFDDENIELVDENDIKISFGFTDEMMAHYLQRADSSYLLFYQAEDIEESLREWQKEDKEYLSNGKPKEPIIAPPKTTSTKEIESHEPYCI